MNAAKQRKGIRTQPRPKGYRPAPPNSASFNLHSYSVKDGKGSEYLNLENSNEHLVTSFLSLVGCPIQVQTVQGVTYEGILEFISPKLDVILKSAHLRSERKQKKQDQCNLPNKENVLETVAFNFCDIVCMNCTNVDIDYAKRDCLLTDSGISGNGLIKARELKKWEGSDEAHNSGTNMVLEESEGMRNGWGYDEMVRVNEEKYGVKSTFDSTMSTYMTEIVYQDSEEFREKELKAQRMVNEIENDINYKLHDEIDSGISEEDLFSAVKKPDVPSNFQKSHVPPRSRKGPHSASDYHGKPMSNSYQKRMDGEKPLYSQQVKKSIPQGKVISRGPSVGSPRTASPTYQQAVQTSEEIKMTMPKVTPHHPSSQGAGRKPGMLTSATQQPLPSQVATQGILTQESTDVMASNGFEKQIDLTKLKVSTSPGEINGKQVEPNARRKEKEKTLEKFGKVKAKQEAEEPVNIESLKEFSENFKLSEYGSRRKEKQQVTETHPSGKVVDASPRGDIKPAHVIPDISSNVQRNEVAEEIKAKDTDAIQPRNPIDDSRLPPTQDIDEAVVEPEKAPRVSSEPIENTITNNRPTPIVDSQNQDTPLQPQPKEPEDSKIDVSKSNLNPLAEEFDPRKRRVPLSHQVQHPVSSAVANAALSPSPSGIQINQVPGGIIHTNQPPNVAPQRHSGMSTRKRAPGMIIGAMQDTGATVVPGNSVPQYGQSVMLVPSNNFAQGQVYSVRVPQQHYQIVLNTSVNQGPSVHQPMNVGTSGYQDNPQSLYIVTQPNQGGPPPVMSPAQPGYGPNPSSQTRYLIAPTGPYTQLTGSMPPSQQGGAPGPPQMHPHHTAVHPAAQQARPYMFLQHPGTMGIQASPMVTGQPHPTGIQNYQHPS